MSDTPIELSPVKRALLAIARLEAEVARLSTPEPIAIIGMACRVPGARSPEDLWSLLERGQDCVTEVPPDRWDVDALFDPDPEAPGRMNTRHGAFCEGVDRFDAEFFDIAPREAAAMDPQQRLLLEVSWEALERANIDPGALYGSPAGVFMGLGTFDYAARQLAEARPDAIGRYFVSGTVLSVAAGRLSYALGLTGPSLTVDTACSSSLVAVHLACRSLQLGESRVALAGGVGLLLSPTPSVAFSKARMLSPSGACRTFDAAADGYVRGEGCGVIVLKRLSDAEADGDRVLAVIRGSAVNQDGASGGLTVPSGPAQEAVMREAQRRSGVSAGDVAYVEAHGTGTPLGDPIELLSIANVYGRDRAVPLLVGSLKTNVGHLEAAAGIAGLIKVALALREGRVPRHLHFETPNPNFDWTAHRLAVPTATTTLAPGTRRIGAVNAFGFSGTNAHVVIEVPAGPVEHPGAAASVEATLVLSAKSPDRLRSLAARHAERLDTLPAADLADYCSTALHCRAAFPHRLATTAIDPRELAARLRQFAEHGAAASITVRLERGGTSSRIGHPHRRLDLPTTPFHRERFWYDQQGSTNAPLLGAPLRSPFFEGILFAARAGALDPLLDDHRVFGTQVVAGAVMLAAALEAAGSEGILQLSEIQWPQALVVRDGESVELHVSIERGQRLTIKGRGKSDREQDDSDWRTCLLADVAPGQRGGNGVSLAGLRERCPTAVRASVLYDAARRHGIALGPRFRRLDDIWAGADEAVGRCEAPSGFAGGESGQLHPGLIDAGFQLLLVVLGEDYRGTMVPVRLAAVRLTAWPDQRGTLWCHLRITRRGPDSASADVCFFDEAGHPFLEIDGLDVQVVDSAALLGAASRAPDSWFFETVWREQRLSRPRVIDIATTVPGRTPAAERAAYADGRRALEQASLAYVAAAYRQQPEVVPAHARLDARLRQRLGVASSGDPEAAMAAIAAAHPSIAPEQTLLARCGPALADVLSGRRNGLQLLFPDGDASALAGIYAASFATRVLNESVSQVVRAWVAAAGPGSIHVLEVGAGTGATSAIVLDALPEDRSAYTYTDIATLFLGQARERFSGRHCLDYRLLDIERDPLAQRFTQGSQDIVVAANVLHATRDLGETLAHVRALLGEGGMLVLVEATAPQLWLDVTFGLTDGWWRCADGRDHPLLDADQWTARLESAGFDQVSVLGDSAALGQAVILARAQPADWAAGRAAIVHRVEDASTPEESLAVAQDATAVLRDAAARVPPPSVTFVTSDGARGGFANAVLSGLVKVAALEHPELRPRLIDSDGAVPEALAAALTHDGRDVELAIRAGRLLVPRLVRRPPAPGAAPIVPDDSWCVITGGYGGLGLAVAEWLAGKGARHIALIGRRPPPAETRARIETWGAEVETLLADVADADALGAALDRLSSRPIRGIYHAAGVLDDATLAHLEPAQLASTFAPKVHGGWNLHRLTRGQPVGQFVLFSSAAALLGSTGQAAHAAANAWLDGLARHRHALGLPATSIAWGAWSRIGAAARLGRDETFRRQGFGTIDPAAGLDALARLLAEPATARGVVPIDLPRLLAQRPGWPHFAELAAELEEASVDVPPSAPLTGIDLAGLLGEIARVLGLRTAGGLDPDRTFTELGMDSLSALELRNRLQARLGVALPTTIIYEQSTARRLADKLATLAPQAVSAVAPVGLASDTFELARYQSVVDAMSEAEIDSLLKGLLDTKP